ncbi:MAG: aspartate aminotransferase family protein [Chloroflexi bacterium]|nr:aspartate aminotransferase family protein [Chloroflexota bacterium]
MKPEEIIQAEKQYLAQTYIRPPFVLTRGEGVYVYDAAGNKYLDTAAGIAVNALGYSDPELVKAIQDAATGLLHTSNLFYTESQVALAKTLVEKSFADKVFFSNTGTEAIEGALKFARKYHAERADTQRKNFVALRGSFHGRSMGALAVTDSEKYQAPFRPLMPGVSFANFNDLDSVRAAITNETAAVIIEPVQGEGGVYPASDEFMRGVRALCDARGALLIFDEIQCGVGRTGKLWGHAWSGVTPDIMTIAKPLAGGLPIGAILMTDAVASAMHAGEHGTTFGGGSFITAIALNVFNRVSDPKFLAHVNETGNYLMERLSEINSPHIKEVRGRGLMIGLELDIDAAKVRERGYTHGLLLIQAREKVVRFVPPLVFQKTHVDELVEGLAKVLTEVG